MWCITPTFLKLFSLGWWDTPRTSPLTGGSCPVWPSLLLNSHVTKPRLQDPSVCSNSLIALILSYGFNHLYMLVMPHWLRSQNLPRNSRRALMWVLVLCTHSIWDFPIGKSDSHLKLRMPPLVSLSIPFFPSQIPCRVAHAACSTCKVYPKLHYLCEGTTCSGPSTALLPLMPPC